MPEHLYSLNEIRRRELAIIREYRRRLQALELRGGAPNEIEKDPKLVGLALSGGGVRSATFHLGILQALAQGGVLPWIDYISSVSGGGYISAWLAKWLSLSDYDDVLRSLTPFAEQAEPEKIHWLRQHSSYLTPRLGIFSHDSLAFITTYCHHLLQNLLLIIFMIGAILFYPRVVLLLLKMAYLHSGVPEFASILGAFSALVGVVLILLYFRRSRRKPELLPSSAHLIKSLILNVALVVVPVSFFGSISYWGYYPDWPISLAIAMICAFCVNDLWIKYDVKVTWRQKTCAGLGLVSAFPIMLWLYYVANNHTDATLPAWRIQGWIQALLFRFVPSPAVGHTDAVTTLAERLWNRLVDHFGPTVTLAVLLLLIAVFIVFCKQWALNKLTPTTSVIWFKVSKELLKVTLATVAIALLGVYVTYRGEDLVYHLSDWSKRSPGRPPTVLFPHLFGPILTACAVVGALAFNMLIALVSRMLTFHVRTQITLVFAYFYKYLAIWFITAGVSFYGPILLYNWRTVPAAIVFGVWLASILFGLTLRDHTEKTTRLRRRAYSFIGTVSGYIFLAGVFLFVSWLVSFVVLRIGWLPVPFTMAQYWAEVDYSSQPSLLIVFAGLMSLLVVLSARFGINQSSMHLFYQGKLADAYLDEALPGSEKFPNLNRSAHARLDRLVTTRQSKYIGPYVLFNATLNLAKASEPAWQERHSANFIFSPLFSGYELPFRGKTKKTSAFKKTRKFSYSGLDGIFLAHAMAISASALGSNMGVHTSPRRRFLHTVLNIRLGWWFANPSFPGSWGGNLLRSRVNFLWDEFMGHTDEHGPFVHLSDGGHFENLGLYELVRRRCRLIIVSDATEDAHQSYRALGVAIQRCRVDLGAEISIDPTGGNLPGTSTGHSFCVGRVSYRDARSGVIVYVKAKLIGQIPMDVVSFGRLNPDFPNEPTINQWFQESQFESYRRLGVVLGLEITRALSLGEAEDICDRSESLFMGRASI